MPDKFFHVFATKIMQKLLKKRKKFYDLGVLAQGLIGPKGNRWLDAITSQICTPRPGLKLQTEDTAKYHLMDTTEWCSFFVSGVGWR